MLSLLQALRLLQISDSRHGSSAVQVFQQIPLLPFVMDLHAVQDLLYARSVLMLNRRYRLFLKAESCSPERAQSQNQCKQKKHSSNFVEWLTWVCRVSHRHPRGEHRTVANRIFLPLLTMLNGEVLQ